MSEVETAWLVNQRLDWLAAQDGAFGPGGELGPSLSVAAVIVGRMLAVEIWWVS